MSFYDDHKAEADAAGVTSAQIEDFASRNPGHEGRGFDYGRAIEALTNYTGDRPFDSQSAMYDQRTNQLSAAGRTALQARPQTLGQLIGLEGGDPRLSPAAMAQHGLGGVPITGVPTLGQLVLPSSSHVTAPDWAYLTRGR